jgi:predicted amidohydrolase
VQAESVTVGLVQWLPRRGAIDDNLSTALAAVRSAADRGCDVVVLPELWLCGYGTTSAVLEAVRSAEPLDGRVGSLLARVAADCGLVVCAGSFPERHEARIFNTSVVYDRCGARVLTHRKVHLYAAEAEHFGAGDGFSTADIDGLGTVGVCICFDGDFPETGRALRQGGARIVFHPCAYEEATRRWWDLLYPAQALCNGQWWLSCNQHGGAGPTGFFGASRILAPNGAVRAEGPDGPVTPDRPELVVASLALAAELADADATSAVLFDARCPMRDGARHA